MHPTILDSHGFPVRSGSGYGKLIDATQPDAKRRPGWETRMEGVHKAVTYNDWKTMVSASRRLWANFDILKLATVQKAMHAVGRAWGAQHIGEDTKFGDEAAAWVNGEFMGMCDVRGPMFDFKTGLYLDSISFDRCGDNALLLTQAETGYPQVQRIASHRIGQRFSSTGVVGKGDAFSWAMLESGEFEKRTGMYEGLKIELGVIYNRYGRAVACRVLGDTQDEDQDVSVRDLDLRFDPEWLDQGRGFPAFSGSIEFIASSFESHDAEQRALLIASMIGLVENNESGGADPNDPFAALGATTPAGSEEMTTQSFEKGLIRYFKAGTGSGLTSFINPRPGPAWDSFNDRIIRLGLAGMNWPYSLCWKPEGMNGTQERSAIEQARTSVQDRQDLLFPRAKRIICYAVSKAIKLGIIRPYEGKDQGGQLKWAFQMPPRFNIDHGREAQQDRDNLKMGITTMGDYLSRTGSKHGSNVKAHWKERAREAGLKAQAIAETEVEMNVKIDPREVAMMTPNDPPQVVEEEEVVAAPAPAAQEEE